MRLDLLAALNAERAARRAAGIRAMLPQVHDFRPIHNLASMEELCRALSAAGGGAADPRRWLRKAS